MKEWVLHDKEYRVIIHCLKVRKHGICNILSDDNNDINEDGVNKALLDELAVVMRLLEEVANENVTAVEPDEKERIHEFINRAHDQV